MGDITDLRNVSSGDNMTALILEAGDNNLAEYRAQYVVAAQFAQMVCIVRYYTTKKLHI